MKKQLLTLALMLTASILFAQSITFTFENARNTNDGTDDYYEADIFIVSDTDFKLGSGQVYFNYNTAAFGENAFGNGNFEYLQPAGTILAEVYGFPAYKDFIANDNTADRVSTAFQQGVSSGTITAPNVTTTAKHLFSIRIKYVDVNQDPSVTFETGDAFADQFFTACGPEANGFPDCTNFPGTQIVDDTFDSAGSTLSSLSFALENDILLATNSDSLHISYTNSIQLEAYTIFTITGRKVINSTLETTSIAALPRGVYIVLLDFDQGTVSKKFVK